MDVMTPEAETEPRSPARSRKSTEVASIESSAAAVARRSRAGFILRVVLGFGALLLVVVLLVRTLRPQLESVGSWFVDHFGLAGVAVGAFIADGFHFPVPPQFYLLLATAARSDPTAVIAATSAGSVLGGASGYLVARRLGHIRWLARRLERLGGKMSERLGQRHPYRSAVVASCSPIAFSVLCYLAGLFRVRWGPLLVLLVLRLPKIVLYYYLVRVGWSLS